MPNNVEKRVTAKFILDSNGFNSSLQGINQQLKVAQSELKASSAQVGLFGTQQEKSKTTLDGLTKQIELQRQKIDIYRQSIEDTNVKMNKNVAERDRLKTALDQEKIKLEAAIKTYGKESEVATQLKDNIDSLTEEYNKKEKAVVSNAKTIQNYTIQENKAKEGLTKLQAELKKTSSELATSENKWISAGKTLQDSAEKMKSAGDKISNFGTGLTVGVTAPILAIGTAATKMAMDAIESENLFEVSMGDMAESARKWSDQVSKALGLNAYEVRKNVGTFNVMLTSMGQTNDQALQMSESMTQLAYDMASFYNLRPEEAFEKLRAGISGEVEPLKSLGIIVSDNAVQQYALAHGIGQTNVNMAQAQKAAIAVEKAQTKYNAAVKEHGKNSLEAREASADLALKEQSYQKALEGTKVELTDAQKVQARYGLIMQSTSKAQGDLARTMDSPTNKLRIQTEQIKQQAIELGTKLLPILSDLMSVVKSVADWYSGLNDAQKDTIIKFAMMAATIGPVTSGLGTMLKVGGGVASALGKMSSAMGIAKVATAGVGTAAEVAAGTAGAGGLAGLGAGLGGVVLAAAPYLVAAGLVAGTGYLIYKSMTEEAIPAVDLFADKIETTAKSVTDSSNQIASGYSYLDGSIKATSTNAVSYNGNWSTNTETTVTKISESTKKAVGAYMELDNNAKSSLTDLYINSTVITGQLVTDTVTKYNDMASQIKASIEKRNSDELATMTNFYATSNALTDDEEKKILAAMQTNNTAQKEEEDKYVAQIKGILENASKNNRALTLDEQQQINAIQEKMRTNAVKSMSESEVEQKLILERLKGYGERITAEQASAEIKNANKARDESVQAANDKYNKTVAAIIRERDEAHTITADQADKLIAEAERQRKESVNKAEELHSGVVSKITSMDSTISSDVDLTTGNILRKWQSMWDWWQVHVFHTKKATIETVQITNHVDNWEKIPANASGTSSFGGGYTTLHERGYELYNLPRGTRIYNHEASEDIVMKTAEKVAQGVLSKMTSTNTSGTIRIEIPVIMDGREVTRVVAENQDILDRYNNRNLGGVF